MKKQPCDGISNIFGSKAAMLTWLTNPIVQFDTKYSQLLAGHTSSISTMTVNSSIDIRLPVDKFINNGGASVARVRSNKEKEQESTNEDDVTCEDVGNVRKTDNDDATTLYGRPKGQHESHDMR